MAKQDLSHEEVWDDSDLVKSWNEALAEYKKYHSLAAKGEKVDLVLDQAEQKTQDASTGAHENEAATSSAVFEDNSVGDQAASGVEAPQPHQAQAQALAAVGGSMMPQALMNSVQDEGLKNMMMSWYYAGYYTGLYEGQQKAYASMQPGA
ncbi:hypothetical protein KC332_g16216 [Hortaea werneckii]|uniref:Survival Motor Neuron Gemin2-binding domain-containing protein n=2 Tax=Hortaea werneckii TaxID=91943 RepID=A0A3M7IFV8_HORWE|nr:hypothetical protein KC358_g12840 [Hortaea werneckii]OTA22175.1 hypothetical protein BTJ68_14363 [Hortaea werneckii EXF-2000]KAI6810790.1 hypothetical protein KC350_g12428 [Hortaea werneckii]KAI6910242.1 hypothetical protein KC348_g13280 [Hortaea werneckii]KAI6921312.1 hypothetical protein KC341_g16010 [Hortaea werneckii]